MTKLSCTLQPGKPETPVVLDIDSIFKHQQQLFIISYDSYTGLRSLTLYLIPTERRYALYLSLKSYTRWAMVSRFRCLCYRFMM